MDSRQNIARALGLASALASAAYLIWRAGWTLNPAALWLSLPFLVAETHGYLTFLGFLFMTWNCRPVPRQAAAQDATVDFLIPTYNEPFSILAPTIAGAVAIDYPHKTYVLDDGRRNWVRDLCTELGVEYITRPDNKGAKAGNLNHALAQTGGEFVAIVDADFVPARNFIHELLGYFQDPKMAIVQGPQEYYNLDSFQHLQGDAQRWHEQAPFFRTIQQGKNHWNAAFWCGCPSMLRRSALESIGGVQADTITEDLHTSMKLHAAGWKSIYHPAVIALGVAPNDYEGFVLQRLRWAQGAMQVIRREWRLRGLTPAQMINYIASTSTYFDALRKAALLALIPIVVLTDTMPAIASVTTFIPFWFAQFGLGMLANRALGRGSNRLLAIEFFDLLKMFAFIKASGTLLTNRRHTFRVTPKGGTGQPRVNGLLTPYLLIAVIYALTIVLATLRLNGTFGLDAAHPGSMTAATIWAALILSVVLAATYYGYWHTTNRSAGRVSVNASGAYRLQTSQENVPIRLVDLSTAGCAFYAEHAPPVDSEVYLYVGQDSTPYTGKVVRKIAQDSMPVLYRVGVSFHRVR